jgi:hypothetical protein
MAPNTLSCATSIGCEDLALCIPSDDADVAPSDSGVDVSVEGGRDGGPPGSDAGDSGAVGDAGVDSSVVVDGRACDVTKSPSEDPCVIDERVGVFVAPSGNDMSGAGTRESPYKTLEKALASAGSQRRVYACGNGGAGTDYAEQVTLPDGAQLFGGFACNDWSYTPTKRVVVKAPASPALAVHGARAGVVVEDVEFGAPDAMMPGSSSIGALVESSEKVILRRVRVVAGKGAAGQASADGAKGDDGQAASGGQRGSDGVCPAGVASQNGGSWGGPSLCGSRGGNGGLATQGLAGSAGLAGIPQTNVDPPNVDNGGPKSSTVGGNGGDGTAGSVGVAGKPGAASTMGGTFGAEGYTPAPTAGAGTDGSVGQGGGGGGASNASGMCIGASGGAGGMGGCGGKAGTGGSGGGASVALLSWMSSGLVLDTCELVAKDGGAGGKGGDGGTGGLGRSGAEGGAGHSGDAGPSIGKGGKGGPGGNGGAGGPGGGGNGGPSYALVYKGTRPTRTSGTLLTARPGGAAGRGGSVGATKANDGLEGPSAEEFSIP